MNVVPAVLNLCSSTAAPLVDMMYESTTGTTHLYGTLGCAATVRTVAALR